jgi:hypothetical protein
MSELIRVCLALKFIQSYIDSLYILTSLKHPSHKEYTQSPEALSFCSDDAFGVNNWVNETLGITIKLKIMSAAANFIMEILRFLAYSGSSFKS